MKKPFILRFANIMVSGILFIFLASCHNDEVCEQAAVYPMRIGFYIQAQPGVSARAYIADSITVYGVERPDSLIYNNARNVRSIEVPLNPASAKSGFVILFPGNIADTIWVDSQYQLKFISANCGFSVQATIEQATHTNRKISTLQINQKLVTQSFEEHIKIYLFTGTGN